jgi:nucleotide-binding universal stress UspA family protein
MPTGRSSATSSSVQPHPRTIARIAAGIDGYPEGRDAAALASAIARATGAEVTLIGVHPDPLVVLPEGLDWKSLEKQTRATLAEVRDQLAPHARIVVKTDLSVPRALHRVVGRQHSDLLVVGSSRHAPAGRVRIGKRTRQLLCNFDCALAVAPRGLHERAETRFTRIGVGYDDSPESRAALELAGSIAVGAGAALHVRAVVDDRIPAGGFFNGYGVLLPQWEETIEDEVDAISERATEQARATGANVQVEGLRGRPAASLLDLCELVDLVVIGSRRWGAVARLMLGSTGEALMHDASCPVLVVPRPPE